MFSHELIRQTLLSGVSAIERERLHQQAAGAISRLYSDDLEAHAGELAYHLSHAGRAGDRDSLVHYLTIAGERAFDAAAFDDAVGYFEKALSLMPNDDQLGRAQLLERLAMALRSVGRWQDALGTMNDALDRYQTLGQVEAIGRLGWAMVYQLVWTARFVEGVQVGQRTLAALGNTVSADRARLLSALAFAISVSGDYAAATATFNQARALAEQVGNERAMADVLHMQTIHHFVYAEFAEGIRVGLRAAETFERESALWDLCSVQAFVIFQDGNLGSREQATSLADKTLGLAERLGHLGAAFMVLSDRIRVAAMLGDLPQVEALGPQIVDIGERGGLPWRYLGHLYLGLAAHRRGNAERAEAQLRNAVELEPTGAFAGQSAATLARHLAYYGRADEVMELFESARSKLPSLDRVNGIGSWSCLLNFVEAFYLCGLNEEAAALSPLVERVLELDKRWISYDGRLARTRAGLAAVTARRWEEAERHFGIAREVAEQMRNRVELADLCRLHARMLLDRGGAGDHERAAEMLQEALSAYRTFGMPTYAAEAERLQRQARLSGVARAGRRWRPQPYDRQSLVMPALTRSLNGRSAAKQLTRRQTLSDRSPAAKVLTIMMTDVVGSTALRRARGDRGRRRHLGLQAAIVRDEVVAFGGRVRKSLGDGFLISFPSAVAAVRAAAAIQRALREHNTAEPAARRSRSASASTLGQVTEHDGDLYGQAVHAAARVMAEAVGGQILTSDEVRKHAEPQVDWSFLDSGLFWLRGFPGALAAVRGVMERHLSGRPDQCCVGPADAVRGAGCRAGHLHQLIDEAVAGHGRLALVAGEPGVGKSRLVAEIGDEAKARGMRVLVGSLRGDERCAAVPAVCRDRSSRRSATRAARWRCGRRLATWPRRSPVSRRRCGASFPTSRRPSSCRQSSPAAICGTASASSSAAPRRASRCCWCWRTCIGPTSQPCCSPSTWRRCCPRCRCWCSEPTATSKWISHPLARVIGQLGQSAACWNGLACVGLSLDGVSGDAARPSPGSPRPRS